MRKCRKNPPLPRTLPNAVFPGEANAVYVAVVANCSGPAGATLCPAGAVATRTLHRVSFRTTQGVASVGGSCLTSRRACVVEDRLGGAAAALPYSGPGGPQYRVFMPPLSIGPFLSFRVDVAVASSSALLYMCQVRGSAATAAARLAAPSHPPPSQPCFAQSLCNGTQPLCTPDIADVLLPIGPSAGGVASVGPLDYFVNPDGCEYWTIGTAYAPGFVPDRSPRSYAGESTQPPVLFRVAVGCTPLLAMPSAAPTSLLPAALQVVALSETAVTLSVPRPVLQPAAGGAACGGPASTPASSFSVFLAALNASAVDPRFLLSSPLGVREATRAAMLNGSGSFVRPPSVVVPASATANLAPSASSVLATLTGLAPCTAYVVVASLSCSEADGCLPYLAADWPVSPQAVSFVTPPCGSPSGGGGGGGGGSAGPSPAVVAGAVIAVLVILGGAAGGAWWWFRGCAGGQPGQCASRAGGVGTGSASTAQAKWGATGSVLSSEPLDGGVGGAYAAMGAAEYY